MPSSFVVSGSMEMQIRSKQRKGPLPLVRLLFPCLLVDAKDPRQPIPAPARELVIPTRAQNLSADEGVARSVSRSAESGRELNERSDGA